jgi:transcriptional regulator with XRE-family HTH domain
MPSAQEKTDFSDRLWFALRKSTHSVKGATDLARYFNLQYAGKGIAVQTTHKWLTGRSIPTDDKIKILAAWLNVTKHWLHYGSPPSAPARQKTKAQLPSLEVLSLAKKIKALSEHQRYILEELVKQFAGKY